MVINRIHGVRNPVQAKVAFFTANNPLHLHSAATLGDSHKPKVVIRTSFDTRDLQHVDAAEL